MVLILISINLAKKTYQSSSELKQKKKYTKFITLHSIILGFLSNGVTLHFHLSSNLTLYFLRLVLTCVKTFKQAGAELGQAQQ